MKTRVARLMKAMIEYDRGDAMRIHHLLKVHDLVATIGRLENLDDATLEVAEAAAVVHDIGIHLSERKYGSSNGKYQEKEGPGEARLLLKRVGGYTSEEIDRICYLVGHHHTYSHIDGLDYQILVEADWLVNIYEDGLSQEAVNRVRANIFKTPTALHLLDALYGGTPWQAAQLPMEGC